MLVNCRKAVSIAMVTLPVLALWLNTGGHSVEANGQTVPILETTQGLYRVEVRISPATPRVGSLHMVIVLRTLENRQPVNDATVRVRALGPTSESLSVGPVDTYTVPPTFNWYDLNMTLPQEGEWGFTVDITENDQMTRVEFPLMVVSGSINWGIIIVLISAIPFLMAIAWYFRQSARSRLSRRR